ncbi:MAG: glycosyltransferase [Patescibacteria group bacterium]|nr:glycosyltransferase [Patescibacteria group bacterium]
MRIALVHDYLSQDGGAERVLKALHEIWPEAPIFVLFHDRKKINYFDREKIKESFLAKMPFVRSAFQWYLPWMPAATERHDLRDFDVVLSSTSAFAKGVITSPGTLHISYCHTPPRYLWADSLDYVSDLNSGRLVKIFLSNLLHRLRLWDKMSADRVDHFIANSRTVSRRIEKYYRRPSEVINPPIEADQFKISADVGDYYLAGGRLVPYKRLDIVVSAFNRLGWPLKIFGDGPELPRLKKHAKNNIRFLGQISEEEKKELMSRARAFINPQTEDFGLTAVESMASGRPVMAFADGGATETIVPGVTGVFFYQQTWEALLDTLLNFNFSHWDSARIREHARQFDTVIFQEKIKRVVGDHWEDFRKKMTQPALIN